MNQSLLRIAIVVAFASAACGCKSLGFKPKSLWPLDVETAPQTPARMAVIWSDTELFLPNQPATRGFGGRIYFYDDRHDAIAVDGQLVVYVYDDDQGTDRNQPDRKYVFTAEQFAKHKSGSELGPSYSVWIPWDAVGGPTKQLSLVPFFQSAEGGQIVSGELTRHRLPGAAEKEQQQHVETAQQQPQQQQTIADVRAVDYQRPIDNAAAPVDGEAQSTLMRTTTINVSPLTRDRLSSPPAGRLERYRTVPRNSDEQGPRWERYDERASAPTYYGAQSSSAAAEANRLAALAAQEAERAQAHSAPAYRSQPTSAAPLASLARQPSAAGYSPSPRPDRFAQRPPQVPDSQSEQSSGDRSRWPHGREAPPSDPRWPPPRYPEFRDSAASPAAATGGL